MPRIPLLCTDDELNHDDIKRLRQLWDDGIASGSAGEMVMSAARLVSGWRSPRL